MYVREDADGPAKSNPGAGLYPCSVRLIRNSSLVSAEKGRGPARSANQTLCRPPMCAALAVYLASNAEHSVLWPATLIEGNSQSEFWILHSSTKRTANGASVFEPWRALPETAILSWTNRALEIPRRSRPCRKRPCRARYICSDRITRVIRTFPSPLSLHLLPWR